MDAGTGIRKLGDDLMAASHEQYDNIFIGLSHTHWDHIQGFPFFEPAYDPKRRITIAICGKGMQEAVFGGFFSKGRCGDQSLRGSPRETVFFASGTSTENLAPCPSSLSSNSLPPMSSTKTITPAKPNPLPLMVPPFSDPR